MDIAIALPCPTFDPSEESLDTRTVAVERDSHRAETHRKRSCLASFTNSPVVGFVLNTGTRSSAPERMKTSDFVGVFVPGQTLVGFPCNGRKRKTPAQTRTVRCPRRSRRKSELRTETGTAGTRGDRHGHGAGAGDWVGGELLAHAANRTAAFGQRDLGRVERAVLRRLGRVGRSAIAVAAWTHGTSAWWSAGDRRQLLSVCRRRTRITMSR